MFYKQTLGMNLAVAFDVYLINPYNKY